MKHFYYLLLCENLLFDVLGASASASRRSGSLFRQTNGSLQFCEKICMVHKYGSDYNIRSTLHIRVSNDHVQCDKLEMGVPNSKSSETTDEDKSKTTMLASDLHSYNFTQTKPIRISSCILVADYIMNKFAAKEHRIFYTSSKDCTLLWAT